MGCISSGYVYCQSTANCVTDSSSCPVNSTAYTDITGCPVSSNCAGFGLNGIGYLGEPSLTGGFYGNDSSGLTAPPGNPCAIALFNFMGLNLDVSLTGYGVRSYVSKISLPYNQTVYEAI